MIARSREYWIDSIKSIACILVGLMASFLGPIVMMKLMEKMRWPVFFVYPTKIDAVKKHFNW